MTAFPRLLATPALILGALHIGLAFSNVRAAEPANFQQRHAELVAKNDKNQDGRLDAAEREAMRLALKEQRLKTRGPEFKPPPEFLAKYDKDKDGEMGSGEWKTAWDAETKILTDTYDADKDGTLNKTEKEAMLADVGKGKITGIPAFFAGRMAVESRSTEPAYLAAQKELLKFDANSDGIASSEELESIRKSKAQKP